MRSRTFLFVAAGVATLGFAACDDDPFRINWEESPDTVLLYSLARPELNLPSAFNLNTRRLVQIETPGATWPRPPQAAQDSGSEPSRLPLP